MKHSLLCFWLLVLAAVPVLDVGLIHYHADCQCDFCHTLLQARVNYKAADKRISYSWNRPSQMITFLISCESDHDLDL